MARKLNRWYQAHRARRIGAVERAAARWWLTSALLITSACSHDWSDQRDASAEGDADSVSSGDASEADQGDRTTASDGATAPGSDANGDVDAGAPDAQSTSDASFSSSDAGSDASSAQGTDAAPVEAGSTDGSSPSAARFCSKVDAAFCSDFEEGDAALDSFSWTELDPAGQATLRVVDEGAPPSVRALRSTLTGAKDESARIAVKFLDSAQPRWFRARFDFRPQFSLPVESDELVYWFKLSEQSGDSYPGVSLATCANGTFLVVENLDGTTESYEMYPTLDLPSGWVHVEIEIYSGANGSAVVRFNDKIAVSYAGIVRVTNVTQAFALFGIYLNSGPASWALYDNVSVEFAP